MAIRPAGKLEPKVIAGRVALAVVCVLGGQWLITFWGVCCWFWKRRKQSIDGSSDPVVGRVARRVRNWER